MLSSTAAWFDSPFMKACRSEQTPYTPIWLMRQAGRFMSEFRAIRSRVGFLELCKNPELAAQVTVMAVDMLEVDAAIIFADILLPLEPMGVGLEYVRGEGPVIHRPVRGLADCRQLAEVVVEESLDYVLTAIKLTRQALKPAIPLIGFAAAPFTLASYLIEGGASRNFEATKTLMRTEPETWELLMSKIASVTLHYLNCQVAAGAQVVQLFDSWVGCLSPVDYRQFVQPYTKRVIDGIAPGTPVIHFGTGTGSLLTLMQAAGGDVIGLDWRVNLGDAWAQLASPVAVQGNLDPTVLLSGRQEIKRQASLILEAASRRPGHIFNLGHGVLPTTEVDNVRYLVDYVHSFRRNQ